MNLTPMSERSEHLQAELDAILETVKVSHSKLKICELLEEGKKLHEALNPETKHGGDRRSEKARSSEGTSSSVACYAEFVHKETGVAVGLIREYLRIAAKLSKEVKDLIRGKRFANNKTALLDLARLPTEQQKQLAVPIAQGAKNIAEAWRLLNKDAPVNQEQNPVKAQSLTRIPKHIKEAGQGLTQLWALCELLKQGASWQDADREKIAEVLESQEGSLDLIRNSLTELERTLNTQKLNPGTRESIEADKQTTPPQLSRVRENKRTSSIVQPSFPEVLNIVGS